MKDSDTTNLYSNKLGILNAIDKDIKYNILADKEKSILYEQEMDELDKKYFFDLFNRKIIEMNSSEYFKFILSLCPCEETDHITEENMEELSVLFYRVLTLKACERDSINAMEKMIPGHSKDYEKNRFLTTDTK